MVGLTAHDLGFEPEEEEVVGVLDLPQLYTRPSAKTLLSTLADLSSEPSSWEATPQNGTPRSATPRSMLSGTSTPLRKRRKVKGDGLPAYLTKIVSSPLTWIDDDDIKEMIWETASKRLSERSGRTAMGAIDRTFKLPLLNSESASKPLTSLPSTEEDCIEIVVHEPALTGDNLGFKTWAASYLLSKRLSVMKPILPVLAEDASILELGAGTGLVGISAAAICSRPVVLTDLPVIIPNLQHNISRNATMLAFHRAEARAAVLDWSTPENLRLHDGRNSEAGGFPLILAADVIYSHEHARLLSEAIKFHLSQEQHARLVVELPIREADAPARFELRSRLNEAGLTVVDEGEEIGYDDWSSTLAEEELTEVRCWWSIWSWR